MDIQNWIFGCILLIYVILFCGVWLVVLFTGIVNVVIIFISWILGCCEKRGRL